MKILLIDGERIVLELASMIFKSQGYEVVCAENFSSGNKLINQLHPDIVILEYLIKEEKCFDLVHNIKKLNNPPGIIVFTGRGSEEIAVEILKNGVDDYILKPFNNQDLIYRVEAVYHKKLLNDEISELKHKLNNNFGNHTIKSIEFEPEYYQAGLSILSYFNTIVNQKYPDLEVKIKIEQENLVVRMIVESPDGSKEKIEKTLEEYGLVVKGDLPPEALLQNPFEILSLKNKLELAGLELKQARELYRICENKNTERINSLEIQVRHLNNIIAEGLIGANKNTDLLYYVLDTALLNSDIKKDIQVIIEKVNNDLNKSDEHEVKQMLGRINDKNPEILVKLKEFVFNSFTGTSGSLLYSWIMSLLKKG